jgi:hypothetical protein
MSELQGKIGIRLPRAFILLMGAAVGILLGLVLLLTTGRPAGAALLPGLPSNPITQTAARVATTLLSPVLPSVSSTVSSASAGVLNGASGAVQSLGAPNGPLGLVSGVTLPALPVLSSSPPALLGGIVSQGSRPTPTEPSPPQSAPNAGVALRMGSAASFSQGMSTQSTLVAGLKRPRVLSLGVPRSRCSHRCRRAPLLVRALITVRSTRYPRRSWCWPCSSRQEWVSSAANARRPGST